MGRIKQMLEGLQDRKIRIRYDAKGIRRLQRELKTSVSEFPQFGLIGPMTAAEQEQDLAYRSYAETQDEIENYDLQGQEHYPYTIECEPDLEQEAWGALNKCWKGFKIAKSEFDMMQKALGDYNGN